MKKRDLITSIAAVLLSASSTYADDFEEWHGEGKTIFDIKHSYVSLMGGYSLPTDAELESAAGFATPNVLDIELDGGFLVGAAIGKGYDNFRFEFETTYRQNDIDNYKVNIPGVTTTTVGDQEVSTLSLMFNMYVDFDITDSTSFFLGAGVGAAYIDATSNVTATDGFVSASLISDDTWVMAYQGMAGFSYQLTHQTKLFVQYRLFTTDDPDFSTNVYTAPISHEVVAGITFAW